MNSFFAALAIMPLIFAACSESTSETNPDKPPGDLPACAPRAPAIEGTTFPREAIPTGACASNGDRCAMDIGYVCPGGGVGRIDRAQCTCTEGAWSCALTAENTSSCPSAQADASPPPTDAATD